MWIPDGCLARIGPGSLTYSWNPHIVRRVEKSLLQADGEALDVVDRLSAVVCVSVNEVG